MTSTEQTTSMTQTSKVAELLNEMGEIEQQQQELVIKAREARARLYKAKETLDQSVVTKLKKEAHAKLMRMRYATNNGLSIHALRQAGNKVSVSHIRYADIDGVVALTPVPSFLRGAFTFFARGGATHITIVKPSGEWVCLSSVCHIDDSFDYKMGVKTALEQLSPEEAHGFLNPQEVNPVDL